MTHIFRRPAWFVLLSGAILFGSVLSAGQFEHSPRHPAESEAQAPVQKQEPAYKGKPLEAWLETLRNRAPDMDNAFDAIEMLGPEAKEAVPLLTQIINAPFAPVWIGIDKPETVIGKLRDIQVRARAVDALISIGDAAPSSADVLISWALTRRVFWQNSDSLEERARFVDFVALDVLERMHIAGAINRLGRSTVPAVSALLASRDDEERKFAVAILSERALPVAGTLLKSENCDEREVGLAILIDMWPVVSSDYIRTLMHPCPADAFLLQSHVSHDRGSSEKPAR